MSWYSGGHTNSLVPFFAKGAAARRAKRLAELNDPVYGRTLDNTDLAPIVRAAWGVASH